MFERCRSHAKERGCASMSRVPNVKDSLTRINEEIERRSNPRDRTMLEIYRDHRSEEHTSELQSLMRISYAVFCLKKKNKSNNIQNRYTSQMKQAQRQHKKDEHHDTTVTIHQLQAQTSTRRITI